MNSPHEFAAATLNAILTAKIKPDAISTLPRPEDVEQFIAPLYLALLDMYRDPRPKRSAQKKPGA
jgi:hypothetical protein